MNLDTVREPIPASLAPAGTDSNNLSTLAIQPRKPYRNFFRKAARKSAKIASTAGSTARNGESVRRRRFQRGSVRLNKNKTVWLGEYAEYVLDANGAEKRIRHQIVLRPVRTEDKTIGKREAQRLLQPYVDRVNVALAAPVRERKSATFEAFAEIWERDYLSLSKPSTQSGAKSTLKRLKAAFGRKDMRAIDAGDIQRFIASSMAEGLDPKTIRNHWGMVSLIWNAALAQRYVDALLPKPKLPRKPKKMAKYYTLEMWRGLLRRLRVNIAPCIGLRRKPDCAVVNLQG